jgi:hypothetical protein
MKGTEQIIDQPGSTEKKVRVDWQDDPQAEDLLRKIEGVTWTIANVSLDMIDWSESYTNGARINAPILRDSIDSLSMAMRNGCKIPRPIVHIPEGRKLYVIVSGNQRLNAYKAVGDPTVKIPCYCASFADNLAFETVLRVANVIHGVPFSPAERREHAFYCVKTLGMKESDAARLFLVSDTTISEYVRAMETRISLDRARVPNVERLNQSQLIALARVRDEAMQSKLAHLATQHAPGGERLGQVASVIDKGRSQTDKLKALKSFETELSMQHAGRDNSPSKFVLGRPRRDRLFSMLTNLVGFLEKGIDGTGYTDLEQIQCDREEDKVRLRSLWKRISVRMNLFAE